MPPTPYPNLRQPNPTLIPHPNPGPPNTYSNPKPLTPYPNLRQPNANLNPYPNPRTPNAFPNPNPYPRPPHTNFNSRCLNPSLNPYTNPKGHPLPVTSLQTPVIMSLIPKMTLPTLRGTELPSNKMERNRRVEDWLWKISAMLGAVPNDGLKITLALGVCVDVAGALARLKEFRHLSTLPQFVQAIRDRYKEKVSADEAQVYLQSHKRDDCSTIKDFGTLIMSWVDDLTQELGYDESLAERLAKQLFCRALPPTMGRLLWSVIMF
nr:galectin-3-like [Procambarus clarkii]